ncbi:hypothetical protein ACVRXQ_06585 [Streptococcus panodentis]|uniref:Uncharacterized protein n=1 Tax=Streptococcus panodentis TaxID=1581472 RepID=A0ABS5AV77_9STRE|nr:MULTISPECIES: hypothetical protein [Streptococcus]KXT83167.1 hypothetical protein STRDD11_01649 [Streptococcus sp. DD11]MBP2620477.1 hypothetical protein [Streptococcus panodentis]
MFVLRFNSWFYSTKTLKTFFWLRWIATIAFGLAFLFGFGLNLAYLMTLHGSRLITMTFSVSFIIGLLVLLWTVIRGRREAIVPVLLMILLPSTLLTEFGVTADLYLLLLFFVCYLESSHRRFVVNVAAKLSKEFSPIYSKRLANKNQSRLYRHAYRVLGLLNLDDFRLVREVTKVSSDKVQGLSEKEFIRTFKIKGLLGSTTIKDELYSSPQKSWFFLRRKW